ncbi:uncharacterized protein LOC113360198 [Papaver somniferum]|uniref:uncharacterized protein LOC113360198 n=1 Tax=Papaver somniferum TaxID=3469 RepID=UPI000E6FCFE2|nr:uncharacterized protein LOC113360198 [Papaver somniferum]
MKLLTPEWTLVTSVILKSKYGFIKYFGHFSISHLGVPYKCQLFMWKLAHQILPILHRLDKHLHLQNTSCYFCDSQVETATHLLLQCPFAAAIWSHFLPHYSSMITSQYSVNDWLQGWSDPDSTFNFRDRQKLNLIVVILWHIWKARCTLAFEHTAQSPQSSIHKIVEFCRFHRISWQLTSNVQTTTLAVPNITMAVRQQPHHAQIFPTSDDHNYNFHMNVDASILPNSHTAGIAFVLTTPFASFMTASASPIWERNIIHGEMIALHTTLQWLSSHQLSNVLIRSDCKKLVDALYGSINSVSWIDKSLLLACCGLLNNLCNVSVQYVGRVQNKAADTLAKFARSYVSSMQ